MNVKSPITCRRGIPGCAGVRCVCTEDNMKITPKSKVNTDKLCMRSTVKRVQRISYLVTQRDASWAYVQNTYTCTCTSRLNNLTDEFQDLHLLTPIHAWLSTITSLVPSP